MDENRKELFLMLKNNAEDIKNTLSSKELQLAKLDTLLRERNRVFVKLRDILTETSIDDEEEKLIQGMIEDNGFILERINEIKQDMESKFNKKESDANKISKYSPDNLKG